MIAGEELAAWLGSRRAQGDTTEKMKLVASRLRRMPALRRLCGALEGARHEGADAVLALAEAFVSSAGAISEILSALIAAATDDPYFRPHFGLVASEVHSGLLLVDHPALSLTLGLMSADSIAAKRAERTGGGSLTFNGRRMALHCIKGGGATLSLWEAPRIGAGFTADSSGLCRCVERLRLEDGQKLDIDGRTVTFIVEAAEHDIVFVSAETSLESAPLSVEYDWQSRRFVGASSTDEASSRTQMMLSLLRIMDRRDAVPLFPEMLRSGHFYARWQAMREFLALDAGAALPHLREMAAADPHREVRQAAAQTLAGLGAEGPAPCRS
jgi:hypothetical protein